MCIFDVAGSEHQARVPALRDLTETPSCEESGREWRMDRKTVVQGKDGYVRIFSKVVRERQLRRWCFLESVSEN